jgi:hypothetical protein
MNPEFCEFELDLDGEKVEFKLQLLNKKTCTKLIYDYMALMAKMNETGELPSFDELNRFACPIFAKGFAIYQGDGTELTNLEFFFDKPDLLFQAVKEGMRGNAPKLFFRLERTN